MLGTSGAADARGRLALAWLRLRQNNGARINHMAWVSDERLKHEQRNPAGEDSPAGGLMLSGDQKAPRIIQLGSTQRERL
jgi:hypothetical protein